MSYSSKVLNVFQEYSDTVEDELSGGEYYKHAELIDESIHYPDYQWKKNRAEVTQTTTLATQEQETAGMNCSSFERDKGETVPLQNFHFESGPQTSSGKLDKRDPEYVLCNETPKRSEEEMCLDDEAFNTFLKHLETLDDELTGGENYKDVELADESVSQHSSYNLNFHQENTILGTPTPTLGLPEQETVDTDCSSFHQNKSETVPLQNSHFEIGPQIVSRKPDKYYSENSTDDMFYDTEEFHIFREYLETDGDKASRGEIYKHHEISDGGVRERSSDDRKCYQSVNMTLRHLIPRENEFISNSHNQDGEVKLIPDSFRLFVLDPSTSKRVYI